MVPIYDKDGENIGFIVSSKETAECLSRTLIETVVHTEESEATGKVSIEEWSEIFGRWEKNEDKDKGVL